MLLTRRTALIGLAATAATLSVPGLARATLPSEARSLKMVNLHTGERFKGVYAEGGDYDPAALAQINSVLRDHRADEATEMDPALFDWMVSLQERLGGDEFHIISGYRAPKTNAAMRREGRGVAKKSYHMKGQAIDLRMTGVKTADIRDLARTDQLGGVGYYSKSDFVHIDTGRVRTW